ncbi:MAG: hypothetical protein PHU14_12165 [Methylovulum sp.]|nr:hypothetical protein [Methylovulum sp.]
MKGWPNLRLPEGRDFIKLAAFMHNNSMPLPAIAEATRLPLEQVHNFYNACYLVGLIEKVEAVQRHERTTSVERQNLLGKLRNRLNMQ